MLLGDVPPSPDLLKLGNAKTVPSFFFVATESLSERRKVLNQTDECRAGSLALDDLGAHEARLPCRLTLAQCH
jgi:hypothetical protein